MFSPLRLFRRDTSPTPDEVRRARQMLPVGLDLNGYRVGEALGGGGFSVVYHGTRLSDGVRVVLKEYLPNSQAMRVDDTRVEPLSIETESLFRQGIRRIFDEAAALARVKHPSIVEVLDVFRANNTVYLVMRYESGQDLRRFLKQNPGPRSERFIRTVFAQLLSGLRELHGHRILHLDIKPANIYLKPGGRAMLLDFGATRASVIERKSLVPHTLTHGYAPPEQHQGGHMGAWSDLYGFGATIHACLTGEAPQSAAQRVLKDRYRPVARTLKGDYSESLLEAVDWCLTLRQNERPQNVEAIAEALNPDRAPGVGHATRRLRLPFSWR